MSVLPVAALTLLCIASAIGDCVYKGETYETGAQWKPDVCTACYCDGAGEAQCFEIQCHLPDCDEYVTSPNRCCPYCPMRFFG